MSTFKEDLPETLPRWEIPSDWQWVNIADVGKVITGNTPPTKDESNYGNYIPFVKPPALIDGGIRSTSEGLSESGAQLSRTLPIGAVLVSCIGGLGKTGIAKVPVAFNQQINAIVFDERVVPEFGFYYAQTLKPWLHGVASATTLPIVNKGKFQRAPFPLAPLDQQKLIVAEIEKQFSRLDEAVANLKRVKANLKRYKAAVLKYTFEGKYSEKWHKAKVGELFRVVGGGTPTTSNTEFWSGEYPWISSADIDDLYNITPRRRITKNAINSSATNLVPKGSIIVVTRVGLGKVAEAKEDLCFSQDCQGLIFDKNIINSKFAMLQLSRKVQLFKYISRGTTISGVTKKQLLELEFMLPPVEDQQKIAEQIERQLSITDEFETQVDVNMKRADRLRQSILNKAFSGGLGDSASNAFKAALVQQ